MSSNNPPVVVGVEAVAHRISSVALRFAAEEARARRTGVVIVHGCAAAADGTMLAPIITPEQRDQGQRLVAAAAQVVRRLVGEGTPVTEQSTDQTGSASLLAAAEGAALVVVQRKAGSALGRLLAGSTSSTVAAQAPCPVVVVHADDRPVEPGGIVVGVDRRGHSGSAVLQAAVEASWRQVPMTAVQAWSAPLDSPPHTSYVGADDSERRFHRDAAERALSESLAGLQERHPDVEMHRRLVHGDVVASLLDSSEQAVLLVVGRHTSPHLATIGLGHVARALIDRAGCPVMVVPPDPADQRTWESLTTPVAVGTGY